LTMWPTSAGSLEATPDTTEDDSLRLTTISTNEHEVANGFVKNGSSLPYVYETNDSGNRKRSSKMIPICGICGKKFVCVTTMKRHLVTHTGEKPFSCKVCGKQYTQKGNLRVHERTHANHRPFECNICKQKFYRKEPMQKHQWRQHAIVHFKTRPANSNSSAPLAIIGAEGVLYNSLLRGIKGSGNGGLGQNDAALYDDSSEALEMQLVAEHTPLPLSEVPEPSAHTEVDNFSDTDSISNHSVSNAVTKYLNGNDNNLEEPAENMIDNPSESMAQLQLLKSGLLVQPKEEVLEADERLEDAAQKPMKLKMKLAQAYMREVKEEREREERDSRERSGRDGSYDPHNIEGEDSSSGIGHHLSEIQLSTRSSMERVQMVENKREEVVTMKEESTSEGGSVECTCKSCGSKCLVSDPYNFRCSTCQVKYTSLPTHLIADPLQCIGCLETFAHKPAMKAHQSSTDKERPFRCCRCVHNFRQKAHLQKHQWRIHRRKLEPDPNVKEAKAILQAVSEMTSCPPPPDTTLTIQQIIESSVERGLRDEGEGSNSGGKPLDLSPSKACVDMTKICLDMPHSKMNSITAWLQQVETARSPIKPDISILRKPIESHPETQEQPKSQHHHQPFLTIVSPITPRPEDASLTIKLMEPKGIVWPTEPLPQQYAVKSRPVPAPSPGLQPSWRRPERQDNPLLNQRPDMLSQVSLEVSPPTPSPTIPSQTMSNYKLQDVEATSYKRARTDTDFSSSFPTDLTKPHPLDLSSDYRGQRVNKGDNSSPFDYSINRSELISGQLNRLKNLDNRSGI